MRTYEREKKAQRSLSRKVRREGFLYMEERIQIISDPHLRDTVSFSRKTRDQARDLMKDQLRTIDLPHLRNMWLLMQMLQDEYLLLRRHRLRPRPESLLDLLFEHNADDSAWSPSPWFSVQSLLSELGVHVVPARPGTSFRFLGHETSYELQQKDNAEFAHNYSMRPKTYNNGLVVPYGSDSPLELARFLDDYLERFRPLLGLPYFDTTPVQELVVSKNPIRSTTGMRKHWATATATSTAAGQSLLGDLLQECGERNRRKAIAQAKQRLRKRSRDSSS